MNLIPNIKIGVLRLPAFTAAISLLIFSNLAIAQSSVLKPIEVGDPPPPGAIGLSSDRKSSGELESLGAPATAYMHIAGSTFVPMYGDTNPQYDFGGCTYSSSGSVPHAYYNFPVILPPGSTITSLRFYYKDTSPSDSTLRLREMDDGRSVTDVAVLSSSGNLGYNYTTVSDLNHVVDYVNYSYVLQWQGNVTGPTMELCGARIGYIPPGIFGAALPLIKKDQ